MIEDTKESWSVKAITTEVQNPNLSLVLPPQQCQQSAYQTTDLLDTNPSPDTVYTNRNHPMYWTDPDAYYIDT